MTPPGEAKTPRGVLLYRGAEADVVRAPWCGNDAVYKVRKPLSYRLAVLDAEIRRQRTVHEAEMIGAAKKGGVRTPYLFFVDAKGATLVMEFVSGPRMKDLIPSVPSEVVASMFAGLGADAARLHAAGIMHGDLTTANVIKRGGGLVFLDFGLSVHSDRVEDHAVDLRLIKETIIGAHSAVAGPAVDALIGGYRSVAGEARTKKVVKQLRAIERRGRYARVE